MPPAGQNCRWGGRTLLARQLIGTALRDTGGRLLGRVRDVGFQLGEVTCVRTERGTFRAVARAGNRIVAGEPVPHTGPWLADRPSVNGGEAYIADLVLGDGLRAPLYVLSHGLVSDLMAGRDLMPATRAEIGGGGDALPELR